MRAIAAMLLFALASCAVAPTNSHGFGQPETWPMVEVEGVTVDDAAEAIAATHAHAQYKSVVVGSAHDRDAPDGFWVTAGEREVSVTTEDYGPLPSSRMVKMRYHYIIEDTGGGVRVRGAQRGVVPGFGPITGQYLEHSLDYGADGDRWTRDRLDRCAEILRGRAEVLRGRAMAAEWTARQRAKSAGSEN